MAIGDDIIDSDLSDEAILELLMEKRRREIARKKTIEKERTQEQEKLKNAKADVHQDLRREIKADVNTTENVKKHNNKQVMKPTTIEDLKVNMTEMFDNVLYRVGQLHSDIKKDLHNLEEEMANLQSKADQSISDGSAIRNSLVVIRDKQDNLAQDLERAKIMSSMSPIKTDCQCQKNSTAERDVPQRSHTFSSNVSANVQMRQEAERHPPQNNFNPQCQPTLGTNGDFSNNYNYSNFNENYAYDYVYDDYGYGYDDSYGNQAAYANQANSGVNNMDERKVHFRDDMMPQNQGSNLMPRANNGTKQTNKKKKVKTVYENSNLKTIPGMPAAANSEHQPASTTSRPPAPQKGQDPHHKNHQYDQATQDQQDWQNPHAKKNSKNDKDAKKGTQKPKTSEENRCAKEIMFFGEEEPQYINKQQYDRDLFDTITCTLAEVSSTHLKSLGYNVKEGDIVRVKVIHSWTGPEDHLPMVATFKDEETCNRAKRAIKSGNFYKRRTHSRFGKYKISGDRQLDEENRRFLESIRHKFARPSTPKAIRLKRKQERQERDNNEEYRKKKKRKRLLERKKKD